MTNINLKKWQHPTTGEVRVYVNSARLWPGVKLWFFRAEAAGQAFADFRIVGVRDACARRAAEDLANEIGSECGGDWNRLLAMAQ